MVKRFGGCIDPTFSHAPTKLFIMEINTFCILPANVCCVTWSKVGNLHVICVLWDWASTFRSTYRTSKNKKPHVIFDTLHSVSNKIKHYSKTLELHLLVFQVNWVEVILAAWLFCPPKYHLLFLSRCKFGGMIILPTKITSNCFPSKTSRLYLEGKKIASFFWRWP